MQLYFPSLFRVYSINTPKCLQLTHSHMPLYSHFNLIKLITDNSLNNVWYTGVYNRVGESSQSRIILASRQA